MKYDVIIVGGGIAGLTSAAYLSKDGYKVLVVEKENYVGGLVNSFEYKGFTFDGGIRAIENSGIVMPMLKQLGIEVPFKRSIVSVGIEEDIVRIEDKNALLDYQNLLISKFPENEKDILNIIQEIRQIMKYMDILYGIDNPLFMDMMKDKLYLFKTILPWLVKYMFTVGKINKLNTPVEEYLAKLTKNQALIDMIAQHFFKHTPTFFALSYFSLYLDYQYPIEGTGMLIQKIKEFILEHHGEIKTNTEITEVNSYKKEIIDKDGNTYHYEDLVWATDLKLLYKELNLEEISNQSTKNKTSLYKKSIEDLRGGDSIQTVFMTVDLTPNFFSNQCSEHFFYTPFKNGLFETMQKLPVVLKNKNKDEMIDWVKSYLKYTTYEISLPVLRNEKLAPKNQTGLIVSTLMDYDFVKTIQTMGWYEEYKNLSSEVIIDCLNNTIYKGFKTKVMDSMCSTPLTIERLTNNTDGAITGWAFTNKTMPVVHRMTNVTKSVLTTIPNIFQAGQWSYSPAGLPISIMTGKLAYDQIKKKRK